MRKFYLALAAMFFAAALPAAHAAPAPTAETCLACHNGMEGEVQIKQELYAKSVHGAFDCVMCHMTLKGGQHEGLSGKPDKGTAAIAEELGAKKSRDVIALAACAQCHVDTYESYKASIHGRNVMVKKTSDGPVCTSCHGSPHYIQPKTSKDSAVNHFNVVRTCGVCHEEKFMSEKYGFSDHVMERYKESFHGRKLRIGHPGAPSCVSCHGSHTISSAKEANSPVNAQNKKATCSRCHSGATDKFVAAITHKPLHPIAHFTEIALIFLTVGVFLFICSHVVLDIFADIRDRLFKKGGDHE
jgi:hypothetical protein